jgi:hypothetical protein
MEPANQDATTVKSGPAAPIGPGKEPEIRGNSVGGRRWNGGYRLKHAEVGGPLCHDPRA